MNYQLITTSSELKQVCEQASRHTYIALDTEFVRTRTYYPQLGLIQLFDGETLSLIDPLPITDWQPFVELLKIPTSQSYCMRVAKIWRFLSMIFRRCQRQ